MTLDLVVAPWLTGRDSAPIAVVLAINPRSKIMSLRTMPRGHLASTIDLGRIEAAKALKNLGAAAKYWNYDPQAAKQLLAAGIERVPRTTAIRGGAPTTEAGRGAPWRRRSNRPAGCRLHLCGSSEWRDEGLHRCLR